MVKISSKRPNWIWHKQEFEGGKSCQIFALLNVNTAIWQVFDLVENQIACWEIGLFWRAFHHRVLLVLVLFSQSENPRNPREKEEKEKGEEAASREEELVVQLWEY